MDSDEMDARRRELKDYWEGEGGFREYYQIEMVPLPAVPERDVIDGCLILGTGDPDLRNVAARFAKCFKRELRNDFSPFLAESSTEGEEVFLVKSQKVNMLAPVACGAIGFDTQENCLRWVWLHPFERGTGLLRRVWDVLEHRHGVDFWVETPVSTPMRKFLEHAGVDPSRWGGPQQ